MRVALCSQCTALEQGLAVVAALVVDVPSCVHVVHGIHCYRQRFPEVVIEGLLCLLTDSQSEVLDIRLRVHASANLASALGLVGTHVVLAEEELPVEVGNLDAVVVSHHQLPLTGTQTHQGEHLYELATQRTGANHECSRVLNLLEDFSTENLDVMVVLSILRCLVDVPGRERLEEFMMKPLSDGRELASELYDLLCNDTTPK